MCNYNAPRSAKLVFAAVMAIFGLMICRCGYLQFFRCGHYRDLCEKQQQGLVIRNPCRGAILDCRGRILAASNRVDTVFVEPRVIQDARQTGKRLGQILQMDGDLVSSLIAGSKNPGFARIMAGAEPIQSSAALAVRGVGVSRNWRRYWPTGSLMSHVVGFTGTDGVGLAGVEFEYQNELAGMAGKDFFVADAQRRPLRILQASRSTDGNGIILTLDAAIQQFARSELSAQLELYQANSGVAIVAEVQTGAILAMVSLPDFDPENVDSCDPNLFRNSAVSDQFEPGSLIKPIAVAIAIDAGAVSPEDTIFCEWGCYSGRGFGRIGEYGTHKFGNLSVRDVLVNSSNIGAAKIGQQTGAEKLYRGLRLFGFGRKSELRLPGEAEGLLRQPKLWTGYSITRIPFGQEMSVTAVQLVRAFCILANEGRLVRPHIVRATVDNGGSIVRMKRPPPAVGYVINPLTARWVVEEALTGVVKEGTGRKAALAKWTVFGKTGTANIACSDQRGYEPNAYVASFVGGAPAENPAVVVLVSIWRPTVALGRGYTGGTVAAPVAGRILEKTMTYLRIPPSPKPVAAMPR